MKTKNIKINEVDNLLLNMQGGLLPESLSKKEIKLLENEYGKYWFKVLGYEEPKYKKPQYEK